MQRRIPAVLMRGGTSKGLFFHGNHLPADAQFRNRVILAAYGSPDPSRRQLDGVGGGVSTTSKVAIIDASEDPRYDVLYNFGQVAIDRPLVDFKGNCGNISSAVGPFAVDEGLVRAVEPVTRVRIHQKNTDKLIVAEVPVRNGRYDEEGDYAIAGVPGTAGRVTLRFSDPGGAVTGRLFPTGAVKDIFEAPGRGQVEATFIDAANPVVLVRADSLGLEGAEIDAIEADAELKAALEAIRCQAAVRVGISRSEIEAMRSSQAVPKIALVAKAMSYTATDGRRIGAKEIDFTARMMSMGTLHRTFAVSGAVAAVGAARVEGTVACDVLRPDAGKRQMLRIGHPGGVMDVGALVESGPDGIRYREAVVGRTARRLMEGYVLVPERCFA